MLTVDLLERFITFNWSDITFNWSEVRGWIQLLVLVFGGLVSFQNYKKQQA
jgi:hypothetical protein